MQLTSQVFIKYGSRTLKISNIKTTNNLKTTKLMNKKILLLAITSLLYFSCSKSDNDNDNLPDSEENDTITSYEITPPDWILGNWIQVQFDHNFLEFTTDDIISSSNQSGTTESRKETVATLIEAFGTTGVIRIENQVTDSIYRFKIISNGGNLRDDYFIRTSDTSFTKRSELSISSDFIDRDYIKQ